MHLMEFATCDRRKDKRLIFVRPSKMVKMQAEMVETTMEERVRDLQELATIAENKVIDCKNCWGRTGRRFQSYIGITCNEVQAGNEINQ